MGVYIYTVSEKMEQMNPFAEQIYTVDMWTRREEGEGKMNWENKTVVYILSRKAYSEFCRIA